MVELLPNFLLVKLEVVDLDISQKQVQANHHRYHHHHE